MEHFPLVDRLHTDVLEDKYGPISARVLIHNDSIRESHLVDSEGISRTFAITYFPKENPEGKISTIDEKIRSGEPIGKAFREEGYSIRKNVLDVYTLELPGWLMEAFQTGERFAKARLSEFYAKKEGESPIIYGTVVEIYSPDFRGPVINRTDLAQINAATSALEAAGFSRDEIWRRLGTGFQDATEEIEPAKKVSLPVVFELKRKTEARLARAS